LIDWASPLNNNAVKMSASRVTLGVLAGVCIIACTIPIIMHFSFAPQWAMLPLILLAALAVGILSYREHRKVQEALTRCWKRPCTGVGWKRKFPNSPKAEIREFLGLFVSSFGFEAEHRCSFLPGDKLMDIYSTLYPPGGISADCLELETFCMMFKKRYGLDIAGVWNKDVTLGEVFALTGGRNTSN
jgi:hypothetical protein